MIESTRLLWGVMGMAFSSVFRLDIIKIPGVQKWTPNKHFICEVQIWWELHFGTLGIISKSLWYNVLYDWLCKLLAKIENKTFFTIAFDFLFCFKVAGKDQPLACSVLIFLKKQKIYAVNRRATNKTKLSCRFAIVVLMP